MKSRNEHGYGFRPGGKFLQGFMFCLTAEHRCFIELTMTQVSPPPPSPTKLSPRRVDEATGAAHRHMASKRVSMFQDF